jgi:hypothetical protein
MRTLVIACTILWAATIAVAVAMACLKRPGRGHRALRAVEEHIAEDGRSPQPLRAHPRRIDAAAWPPRRR